jgi:tryptophan-rich sensory protein
MSRPTIRPAATVETLYSRGDIQELPDVGPIRPNYVFEKAARERRAITQSPDHVKKSKIREISSDEPKGIPGDDRMMISGSFWAYVVITVIVVLIIAMIAYDGYCLRPIDPQSPLGNASMFFVGGFISMLLIIWAAYRGHISALVDRYRYALIFTYVISLILIIVWGYLFFDQQNYKAAFLTSFVLILLTVWWIYILWPLDQIASSLLVLYLLWLIYLAYGSWWLICPDQ